MHIWCNCDIHKLAGDLLGASRNDLVRSRAFHDVHSKATEQGRSTYGDQKAGDELWRFVAEPGIDI